MKQATCQADGCNEPLTGRRRKYCSRRCGNRESSRRARALGEAAWVNAPTTRSTVTERFTCFYCGAESEGPKQRRDAEHKHRYCSQDCANANRRKPWIECGTCGTSHNGKRRCPMCHPKPAGPTCRVPSKTSRATIYSRACLVCGETTASRHRDVTYCSVACAKKEHMRRKRAVERERGKTDRQRAERYGAEYEPINRRRVFEDAGWVCHICGEETNREYDHADPWSPTLDHIVPISRGGPHTYENVALAHAICNSVKCDGSEAGAVPGV